MNTTKGFCPRGPHILVKEGREDRQKEPNMNLVSNVDNKSRAVGERVREVDPSGQHGLCGNESW